MAGPHSQAERRREQLETAYRQGLIAEYTYIRALPGEPRAGWDIQPTAGNRHIRIVSRDVPAFLAGLIYTPGTPPDQRAAVSAVLDHGIEVDPPAPPANGHVRIEHVNSGVGDDADRIAFNELPRLYGVPMITFRQWVARDQSLAELIQNADRTNPKYIEYADAWVSTREALHWGRSHGRLNPDGTPNPETTRSTAKRFAKPDSAAD